MEDQNKTLISFPKNDLAEYHHVSNKLSESRPKTNLLPRLSSLNLTLPQPFPSSSINFIPCQQPTILPNQPFQTHLLVQYQGGSVIVPQGVASNLTVPSQLPRSVGPAWTPGTPVYQPQINGFNYNYSIGVTGSLPSQPSVPTYSLTMAPSSCSVTTTASSSPTRTLPSLSTLLNATSPLHSASGSVSSQSSNSNTEDSGHTKKRSLTQETSSAPEKRRKRTGKKLPIMKTSSGKKIYKKIHSCEICGRAFARPNDLFRHAKSHWKELGNNQGAFKCPFSKKAAETIKTEDDHCSITGDDHSSRSGSNSPGHSNASSVLEGERDSESDSLNGNQNCHPTGFFSRCDTYKNHLRALHFDYPVGTKKKDRAYVSGTCKGCHKWFNTVDEWIMNHVETGQCPSCFE